MTKTIQKNLKPTGINLYLEYKCSECCAIHWLKLEEVKTPGFIVVCDCNSILRFKPVKKIKIVYKQQAKKKKKNIPVVLDADILQKACDVLSSYGFEHTESSVLIHHAFDRLKTNDVSSLVKLAIKLFGEK